MPDLMQTLFDYIMDHTHETYCQQTRRASYEVQRERAYNKLWDQLTAEQRDIFEEYDYFKNEIQEEELYAMFLAAFDQKATLSRLTNPTVKTPAPYLPSFPSRSRRQTGAAFLSARPALRAQPHR